MNVDTTVAGRARDVVIPNAFREEKRSVRNAPTAKIAPETPLLPREGHLRTARVAPECVRSRTLLRVAFFFERPSAVAAPKSGTEAAGHPPAQHAVALSTRTRRMLARHRLTPPSREVANSGGNGQRGDGDAGDAIVGAKQTPTIRSRPRRWQGPSPRAPSPCAVLGNHDEWGDS